MLSRLPPFERFNPPRSCLNVKMNTVMWTNCINFPWVESVFWGVLLKPKVDCISDKCRLLTWSAAAPCLNSPRGVLVLSVVVTARLGCCNCSANLNTEQMQGRQRFNNRTETVHSTGYKSYNLPAVRSAQFSWKAWLGPRPPELVSKPAAAAVARAGLLPARPHLIPRPAPSLNSGGRARPGRCRRLLSAFVKVNWWNSL